MLSDIMLHLDDDDRAFCLFRSSLISSRATRKTRRNFARYAKNQKGKEPKSIKSKKVGSKEHIVDL